MIFQWCVQKLYLILLLTINPRSCKLPIPEENKINRQTDRRPHNTFLSQTRECTRKYVTCIIEETSIKLRFNPENGASILRDADVHLNYLNGTTTTVKTSHPNNIKKNLGKIVCEVRGGGSYWLGDSVRWWAKMNLRDLLIQFLFYFMIYLVVSKHGQLQFLLPNLHVCHRPLGEGGSPSIISRSSSFERWAISPTTNTLHRPWVRTRYPALVGFTSSPLPQEI